MRCNSCGKPGNKTTCEWCERYVRRELAMIRNMEAYLAKMAGNIEWKREKRLKKYVR